MKTYPQLEDLYGWGTASRVYTYFFYYGGGAEDGDEATKAYHLTAITMILDKLHVIDIEGRRRLHAL